MTTIDSTRETPTTPTAIQFAVSRVMRESWMVYKSQFFPLLAAVAAVYGVIILFNWTLNLVMPPPTGQIEPSDKMIAALLMLPFCALLVFLLNGLNLFILNICRADRPHYALLWAGGPRFFRVFKAWWIGYHIFEFLGCSQMFMLVLDKGVSPSDAAIQSKGLSRGHAAQIFKLMVIVCCIVFSFFLLLPILLLPFLHVVRIVTYLHLSGETPMTCRGTMRT